MRIVFLKRVMQNNNGINGIGYKILSVFMTAAAKRAIKPRSMAIEVIFAWSPKLVMACWMTSWVNFISLTSIVAKRMAIGRRLFGSQTTHILKPKTIS